MPPSLLRQTRKEQKKKSSFKDPFRHIQSLSQKLARSVAAQSAKSVLF